MLIQYALGIVFLIPLYADFTLTISLQNWLYLMLVSFVVGILAQSAILEAMKTLSATTISILNTSQLIISPVLAFFILNESLSMPLLFGGSFIFIAFLIPIFQKNNA